MRDSPIYLFAGGGTGGHLFPGVAVAQVLAETVPGCRIIFAGSDREIEQLIISQYGYEHRSVPIVSSAVLWRNPLSFVWSTWRAYRRAIRQLEHERPACVIGLGGYASVPVGMAASRLGIPLILLEQNVVAGRANCWLSRRANFVCTSFPNTAGLAGGALRVNVTGNPVRRSIAELADEPAGRETTASGVLLVLGGSQGARAVNEATVSVVESLASPFTGWQIVHQTGERDCDMVRERYAARGINHIVEPFFSDLTEWYRKATLAISRAGATTLAELACAGCPTVLVPFPNSVKDHQLHNARLVESCGGAVVVEQSTGATSTADALSDVLKPLLADAPRRAQMATAMRTMARPSAAQDVLDRMSDVLASTSGSPGS